MKKLKLLNYFNKKNLFFKENKCSKSIIKPFITSNTNLKSVNEINSLLIHSVYNKKNKIYFFQKNGWISNLNIINSKAYSLLKKKLYLLILKA